MGEKDYVELLDRFKGSLIGAAVGDALGMPTEEITQDQLDLQFGGKVTGYRKPGRYHPCNHLEAGQYTDDTQQTIILAESLAEKQGFDLHDFGKRIDEWAYRCVSEPGYNRFAGCTSLRAGLDIRAGKDPRKVGRQSRSCGAAMRITPIGLFYHDDHESLVKFAQESASMTHKHPDAIKSAEYVATLVAYLANGGEPEVSAYEAFSPIFNDQTDLTCNIRRVLRNRKSPPEELKKYTGSSQAACETVPMALSCFLYSPDDFETTVINGANLVPGDTDSIACIAGALSGAHNGIDKIPSKYLDSLESRKKIEDLAAELFIKSRTRGVLI